MARVNLVGRATGILTALDREQSQLRKPSRSFALVTSPELTQSEWAVSRRIGVDPGRSTRRHESRHEVFGDFLGLVAGDVRVLAQIQICFARTPNDGRAARIVRS